MSKFGGISLLIIIICVGMGSLPFSNRLDASQMSQEVIDMHQYLFENPIDTSDYFALAGRCQHCHGSDAKGLAMVDSLGNDVNMMDLWRSSMMANSAKDPFWRAKVSHENAVLPAHAASTETKCTSCHAPLGHYKALYEGAQEYRISTMIQDTFGLDGVSCGACHHQSAEELGQLNSGNINFDTSRVAYGPHLFPFGQPMVNFIGFEPKYGAHILDAGICAGCHTLITEPYDLDGNATGEKFIEQATYHEWLNSRYNTEEISCQACHLPVLEEGVVVASQLSLLPKRKPYGLHEMVGANTFMLQLMQEHKDTLGIKAADEQYERTIAKTFEMLQTQSIDLDLAFVEESLDSALFKVTLINKAGHKFPSGYPSRRAFVEFAMVSDEGDTLFISGKLQEDYELAGFDTEMSLEPHHQTIVSEDQVQIYEIVNGNVAGNFTSVLEQATFALKDNRLVPQGFSKSHEVYDTTMIVGLANVDPDFNMLGGTEGSGSDELYFKIALDDFIGKVNVTAKLYYQSLPPNWMKEMFATSTPEINHFKEMYDDADQSPVLVQSDTLLDLALGTSSVQEIANVHTLKVFPNPSTAKVHVQLGTGVEIRAIQLYTISGELVLHESGKSSLIIASLTPGIYVMLVVDEKGNIHRSKISIN